MKIGSIVECVDNNLREGYDYRNVIKPMLKTPYTVRYIGIHEGEPYIILEEIHNPSGYYLGHLKEFGYKMNRFRELQLPDDIQEIINQELQLK